MYHSERITPEMLRSIQAGEEQRPYKTNGSRIVFAKQCIFCEAYFWPRRKDHKYCSGSCRVKACQKRKGYTYQQGRYQKPKVIEQSMQEKTLPSSKFDWKHVGETAVGTAAVEGFKYLTHDRTVMKKLNQIIDLLESRVQTKTPVSTSPLVFLGLHKLGYGTVALFHDSKSGGYLACEESGRWMKQVSRNPERWELME